MTENPSCVVVCVAELGELDVFVSDPERDAQIDMREEVAYIALVGPFEGTGFAIEQGDFPESAKEYVLASLCKVDRLVGGSDGKARVAMFLALLLRLSFHGIAYGIALFMCLAPRIQRTDVAGGGSGRADCRAEFHQRLVGIAGMGEVDEL